MPTPLITYVKIMKIYFVQFVQSYFLICSKTSKINCNFILLISLWNVNFIIAINIYHCNYVFLEQSIEYLLTLGVELTDKVKEILNS